MSLWKTFIDLFKTPDDMQLLTTKPGDEFAGYPNGFKSQIEGSDAAAPKVFEPALQHLPNAFRLGDPEFESDADNARWHAARNDVINHLLQIINDSEWRNHLVLRGSLLLCAWLGSAAREPGDIDWVFRPREVKITDLQAIKLFKDLVGEISADPIAGEAIIEVSRIAEDDIWTYERASGRRIIFPWKAGGLPPGAVQMDIVFEEKLWTEPVQTLVTTAGRAQLICSADKELSLAWKLLWLETDIYPQGKDLYDAALLAEQTYLPLDLLKRVLQGYPDWGGDERKLAADFPLRWQVDWANFKLEYPWVEGEAKDWQERLSDALVKTFE